MAVLMMMAALVSQAQEALRMSLAGDVAAASRKQAQNTVGYYNLLWGPVSMRFNTGASLEYTDNVRYGSVNSPADFILRPRVGANVNWLLTKWNTLNISLDAGYSYYARNRDLNQFFARPGSGLAFDIYVKDWVITVHDHFSVSENAYDNPTQTGRQNTGTLQNDAGITGLWDLDKMTVSTGFDHVDYVSLSSNQYQRDSASDNFFVNAGLKIRPEILVGLQGGLGFVDSQYPGTTNSSYTQKAVQWNGGAFSSVQISEHMSARLDAGYTVYSPDSMGTNSLSNYTTLYFQFSLSHVVNERIHYSLTAGHSVDFAYDGRPRDRYYVRLSPNLGFVRKIGISTPLSWERGTEVSSGSNTYDMYSAGINFGRTLTQKLSGSVYYRWVMESSDQVSLNYTANIVGLNLNYQF